MSDPMMPQQQPSPQRQGQVDPSDAVESNRSWLNETDALTMMGRTELTEQTTLAEFIQMMGMDLQAPAIQQLERFAGAQLDNATPMGKMDAIAQGRNVQPGAGAQAAQALSRSSEMAPGAGAQGVPGLGTPPAAQNGVAGLLARNPR